MSVEEYQVKVYPDRTEWYQNGKLHRLDKPAIEHSDGSKFWFQNGQRHRVDGPAYEWSNGATEYWINDQQYSYDEFIKKTTVRELSVSDIEKLLGYSVKIIKD